MKLLFLNSLTGILYTFAVISVLSISPVDVSASKDNGILVLYPDAPSPYKEVFSQMIDGLQLSTNQSVIKYRIAKHYEIKKIQKWLEDNKIFAKSLVVLSKRALLVSNELKHDLQVYAGAVDILPGKDIISGFSTHIDPFVYLSRLKLLAPNIQMLVFFYIAKDEALVPIINQSATKHNIRVLPIMIPGIKVAVSQIVDTMNAVDPNTTAIWFSSGVIGLNAELLFPYILQQSWIKRIPVFSSMISHTKRGFLFSLYPDYRNVGYELGRVIKKYEITNEPIGTRLIQSVKFILNRRTAQHLGIDLGADTLKTVDIIFPAK